MERGKFPARGAGVAFGGRTGRRGWRRRRSGLGLRAAAVPARWWREARLGLPFSTIARQGLPVPTGVRLMSPLATLAYSRPALAAFAAMGVLWGTFAAVLAGPEGDAGGG